MKRMKKEDRTTPDLHHLISAGTADGVLTQVLRGHLVIESLLVTLIDLKLEQPDAFDSFQLSFPQKINLCLAHHLISANDASLLKELNTLRNRYSHELGYRLAFAESYRLFKIAYANHGVEFSDELLNKMEGSSDGKGLEERLESGEIVSEIFNATAAWLDAIIEANGGKAPLLG